MIFQPQIIGKPLPTLTNPGTAADLLSGKQLIDANGNVLTGTMPTQGAQTITPGATAKTIAAGRYLTGAQTIQGDPDLVPENIKSGVDIFGVAGSIALANKSSNMGYIPSVTSDKLGVISRTSRLSSIYGILINATINYVPTNNTIVSAFFMKYYTEGVAEENSWGVCVTYIDENGIIKSLTLDNPSAGFVSVSEINTDGLEITAKIPGLQTFARGVLFSDTDKGYSAQGFGSQKD